MSKQKIQYYEVNDNKPLYKFKRNSYKKIKTLGEGSFGKVILVKKDNQTNESDSNIFALKISKRFKRVSKKSGPDEKDEKPIELNFIEIRELIIMKKIKHPNVINLVDYKFCHEDREVWILMDYLPTDLSKFYAENYSNPRVMNEKFFKNIAHQILSGVNYLHQNRIIHRDLKLENILYDEEKNIARIGDFGLSRQYDYDINCQYTNVGTYPYKPPELILGLSQYSTSFDIWSLGCIFVEIVINSHLFGEDNELGVIKLMMNIFGTFNEKLLPGYKDFPNSKRLLENIQECQGIGLVNYIKKNQKFEFENENFYDLIVQMLCVDPTKRYSAKKCLEHPWFSEYN
jgi:serine/threonine protein kinase